MKIFYFKLIVLFTFCISGCASFGPFDPKPGMSIKQVSEEAYVPCNGSMRINDEHITFIRNHPQIPEVSIYQTNAHVKYNRASPDCKKELYFRNGVLLSDVEYNQLLSQSIKNKTIPSESEVINRNMYSNNSQKNTSDLKNQLTDKQKGQIMSHIMQMILTGGGNSNYSNNTGRYCINVRPINSQYQVSNVRQVESGNDYVRFQWSYKRQNINGTVGSGVDWKSCGRNQSRFHRSTSSVAECFPC